MARQAPDRVDLPLGQARRSPDPALPVQTREAVLGEIAEVGIDGIYMHLEQLCHRGGGQTCGMEQNVPLEDLQHLAGHADPRTTRLYDRRRRKVMRNIVERISI